MSYYIYKTTNVLNNHFYIGQHKEKKNEYFLDYLGSGIVLNREINKYGKYNFEKEILKLLPDNITREEANKIESEYIKLYFNDPNNINSTDESYGGAGKELICTKCGELKSIQSATGVCMSCLKKDTPIKSEYCDVCGKITKRYELGSCRSCARNKSGFTLVKEGSKVAVYICGNKILDDITPLLSTSRIDNGVSVVYKLNEEMSVLSSNNEPTKLNAIIKNNNATDWLKLTYEGPRSTKNSHFKYNNIICTSDHQFPVKDRGTQIEARNLNIGDQLVGLSNRCKPTYITEIEKLDLNQSSYDIETDNHYFRTSNIISHNCRASLSPWYKNGGINPIDEHDKPIFTGRANMGAITMNLPLIYMKALETFQNHKFERHFLRTLKIYLDQAKKIHMKTIEYIGKSMAQTDPLAYMCGGLLGGRLNPTDQIKDIIKSYTISFGYCGLNEIQMLHSGQSLVEACKDKGSTNTFAYKVLQFLKDYVEDSKNKDGILWALYGTPGESYLTTAVTQFRKYIEDRTFMIPKDRIEYVKSPDYFTNSFHMCVREDITPIEKQDLEQEFYYLSSGGRIQYVRIPDENNLEANKTLMKRAMSKGYYAGINLQKNWCDDCGNTWHDKVGNSLDEFCPKCNSENITSITRVCGYLGLSRKHKDTRLNSGRLQEIKDRISM